ncbi:MAG: M48 family peptidase, partial [Campylobacter sp.]
FHELAHLLYPNHSKKFYEHLSLYMPDWQKRKEILERAAS